MATCRIIVMIICAAAVSGKEAEILPVNLGENVSMPCYGSANKQIVLVEWTRPDLESPEYVFFFRDERSCTSFQHPSFVGRVELMDKEMKDGDVSLILRNVRSSDVGVYECRVLQGKTRSKRANIKTEPVQVISLEVEEEGTKANVWHIGAAASLILVVVVMILVAVNLKIRDGKQKRNTAQQPYTMRGDLNPRPGQQEHDALNIDLLEPLDNCI